MYLRVLICGLFLAGCGDSPTGIGRLPPDHAHGDGLLLPWGELRGLIVYATPQQLVLVDAVRREVRVVRQVLADEVPRELDLSPAETEVAMEALVDRGPPRITVARLDNGTVTRTFAGATCPRYLRDGRLSYMLGDTVFIEGTRITAIVPTPSGCLSWAADGSFFVIPTGSTVQRVTLQTGVAQPIINAPGNGNPSVWIDPDISPNGQTIALVSVSLIQPNPTPNAIYLANIDGTNLRQLAIGVGFFGLSWSPDGTQLLAASVVSGTTGLTLFRIADGSARRLTSSLAYAAAWGG